MNLSGFVVDAADVLHYVRPPPPFFFNIIAALGPMDYMLSFSLAWPSPHRPPSLLSSGQSCILASLREHRMYCVIISAYPLWLQKLHIFAFCVCVCVKGFHGYTVCCKILISRNLIVACNASRLHCSLATILSIVFMH